MTVDEAMPYFSAANRIRDRLQILQQVGLGYISLGQQATTLSGGEAQRIKLAKELARRATGRTLYILDEPTTGLHFEDVRKLLEVLHALVEQGNTVVVIEHNLEVIKTADWVLDLGPEGGDGGGRIVAEGPPEAIAANRGEPHRPFPRPPARRDEAREAPQAGLIRPSDATPMVGLRGSGATREIHGNGANPCALARFGPAHKNAPEGTMLKSYIVEAQGVFVGAAVALERGFRFVATHPRTRPLDGSIWPTLDDVRRVARTLYQTGFLPRTRVAALACARR